MKQILLMIAVVALVGCGTTSEKTPIFTSDPSNPQNVIIEERIRMSWNDYVGPLIWVVPPSKLNFERVRKLDLSYTEITDAGLKEVAKLENLTQLELSFTQITDTGLKELTKLKQLEGLYMERTQITDAGLKELAKLENLIELWLPRQIPKAGITELQKALPKCEIYHK